MPGSAAKKIETGYKHQNRNNNNYYYGFGACIV